MCIGNSERLSRRTFLVPCLRNSAMTDWAWTSSGEEIIRIMRSLLEGTSGVQFDKLAVWTPGIRQILVGHAWKNRDCRIAIAAKPTNTFLGRTSSLPKQRSPVLINRIFGHLLQRIDNEFFESRIILVWIFNHLLER